LDPTQTSDIQSALYQAFDTLIFEDHDADATLIPGLAQKWEVSKDGTEITFYLRKDVKFHNGDPLRADDVVYTIETAMKSPYAVAVTDSFKRVEKINDYTVKVYLKFAYAPALRCFTASQLQIVNKKAREADPKGYGRAPIGTGAYKFVKWVPGSSIELRHSLIIGGGRRPSNTGLLKLFRMSAHRSLPLRKERLIFLTTIRARAQDRALSKTPNLNSMNVIQCLS
jgi:peptide/nickel transport system substrate-binding protein